jgi:hypothetical protein
MSASESASGLLSESLSNATSESRLRLRPRFRYRFQAFSCAWVRPRRIRGCSEPDGVCRGEAQRAEPQRKQFDFVAALWSLPPELLTLAACFENRTTAPECRRRGCYRNHYRMQHPNPDCDCDPDSDTDSKHFHALGCAPGASEAVPNPTESAVAKHSVPNPRGNNSISSQPSGLFLQSS